MQKYVLALVASLPLVALSLTSNAQNQKLPNQEQEHILVAAESTENDSKKLETLSGINLHPTSKGTFQLDFSQELKEDANLEIKNKAGRIVFQKPVSIANNKTAWRYNVGKLQPDTYLIEVKTSDTTYWTKFKVGR
jgi:hypothetical protein